MPLRDDPATLPGHARRCQAATPCLPASWHAAHGLYPAWQSLARRATLPTARMSWHAPREADSGPAATHPGRSLADQLRYRPVVADEELRPAGQVGELRGADVDAQLVV